MDKPPHNARPGTGNSRAISSTQLEIHPNLDEVVHKHLVTIFRKPLQAHNIEIYKAAMERAGSSQIIFDSGCGNGKSTRIIAQRNPDAYVIGIDKSAARLEKRLANAGVDGVENYCLVRADLNDFLRLASNDGITLKKHYLLYPNPWPKKQHLHRRWQGSPVFVDITRLGGDIELRSNWEIYAVEFARALNLADIKNELTPLQITGHAFISDFEAKYYRSGHRLWQIRTI
ncbi:MAG: methyltransferase domain-containing protein [Gammaproteobacteria bacterium]|nr:methyltransferase domain-containing protein [Gammaproteobacteria bacterium]